MDGPFVSAGPVDAFIMSQRHCGIESHWNANRCQFLQFLFLHSSRNVRMP